MIQEPTKVPDQIAVDVMNDSAAVSEATLDDIQNRNRHAFWDSWIGRLPIYGVTSIGSHAHSKPRRMLTKARERVRERNFRGILFDDDQCAHPLIGHSETSLSIGGNGKENIATSSYFMTIRKNTDAIEQSSPGIDETFLKKTSGLPYSDPGCSRCLCCRAGNPGSGHATRRRQGVADCRKNGNQRIHCEDAHQPRFEKNKTLARERRLEMTASETRPRGAPDIEAEALAWLLELDGHHPPWSGGKSSKHGCAQTSRIGMPMSRSSALARVGGAHSLSRCQLDHVRAGRGTPFST